MALGNLCTGTLKCYDNETETGCAQEGDDFYGQDAQYADMGYCIPKKFVFGGTSSQKTVIDNNTGLEWDRTVRTKSWGESVTSCEELGFGGYTDWRLPTVKEWQTIIDYGKLNPAFNTDYFNETSGWFWTNNESLADGNKAWWISSGSGILTTYTKTYSGNFICVRDTDPQHTMPENSSFENVSNEVIKDLTTNLYWQKSYAEDMLWNDALVYCENLNYGGYTDWRLPNINELISLVNYEAKSPASDFPNMPSKTFWSSTTTLNYSTGNVVYANFSSGEVSTRSKTNNYNMPLTRCVRSDLCGEGEFLSGKNCEPSPCTANSCTMEHSDGICIPLTASEFSCGCVEGYIWDAQSSTCQTDPCFDNKCASMDGSDGICTPIDGTKFTCGCINGYFWNGSRCMTKHAFGNICTGIIKCYDDSANEISCAESGEFYGQDAQYTEAGACTPKSFTIKTPDVGHPEEKVVVDNNLGLEWQKSIPADKFDWQHAISYCADLEYAGYTDWRLPKPKEMLSIVDYSRNDPPVDTTYFAGGISSDSAFWTSKKYARNSANSWGIDFHSYYGGELKFYSNDTTLYVRCVRGEILPESPTLTVSTRNGDEIVTDNLTGLIWNKNFAKFDTWKLALAYCENSTYAGYTDWRLPNIFELLSLLNLNYNRASDFPNINLMSTPWSSSTNPFYTTGYTNIWTVRYNGGSMEIKNTYDSGQNTMCVR